MEKFTDSIIQLLNKFDQAILEGDELTACCPFHEENYPSFNVSLSKGVYHCFGCDASGQLEKLIWKMGYSPTRAYMLAAELKKWAKEEGYYAEDKEIVTEFEVPECTGNTEVITIVKRLNSDTIRKFDLRYNLKYEAMIAPVLDSVGNNVGWIGRRMVLGNNRFISAKGFRPTEYLFAQWLYPPDTIVVLVEAPFDAMLLNQWEIPAVASFGAHMSDTQTTLLKGYRGVIMIPDNDDVGLVFGRELFDKGIVDIVHLLYDGVKDVGELPEYELQGLEFAYRQYWSDIK